MDARVIPMLGHQPDTLSGRLDSLHRSMLMQMPEITKICCCLHDEHTDFLKAYLATGAEESMLADCQIKLSSLPKLHSLSRAVDGQFISVGDNSAELDTEILACLESRGVCSAFVMPMTHANSFIGYIFYLSSDASHLPVSYRHELLLYSQIISMTVSAELSMVNALLATVRVSQEFTDVRDFETGLHLDRMARFSQLIAAKLADKYCLSDTWIEHMYLFAGLHDIGKVGVPDHILCKPGRLDEDERKIMQTHVNKGVELLEQVLKEHDLYRLQDINIVRNIVAYHHEYLDGSGYPNGLKSHQIPLEARIATVADIFDALTSRRPYKKAWPVNEALMELQKMRDQGKLDRDCVAVLTEHISEVQAIVTSLADEQDLMVQTHYASGP